MLKVSNALISSTGGSSIEAMVSAKLPSSRIRPFLGCFSTPSVEFGLPLMPPPQTLPAREPARISMLSGREKIGPCSES